jgi:WD40 repeat protein
VSASSDGSCIIWDLTACRRRHSLFANTFFLGVVYHPDESQIVTAGTDRKVRHGQSASHLCLHLHGTGSRGHAFSSRPTRVWCCQKVEWSTDVQLSTRHPEYEVSTVTMHSCWQCHSLQLLTQQLNGGSL